MLWYIGYGIVHFVCCVDLYRELTGQRTISSYVHNGPIPSCVFYVASVIALNIIFWFMSLVNAEIALGFWLLGHFSK